MVSRQFQVQYKVYAELSDGSVAFHRDGYTDVAGRADWLSVSGNHAKPVQRFAIFVTQ